MKKWTKWTEEEDKILVQAIKANPHNKQEAFRQAAAKLENKAVKSCSNRWYTVLSNPKHKKCVGCMFTMVGMTSRLDNRTVNRNKVHITPEKSKKSLWAKVKALLGI